MVEILKVLKDPGEAARDDDFGSSFFLSENDFLGSFFEGSFQEFPSWA